VALLFPEVHADIDWTKGYEFLDKELQQVAREAEVGLRWADKLVKVHRRSGDETWVLIHVEVQAQPDYDLPERMYTYNHRIYDRHRRKVASFAVLADDRPGWRPGPFGYELWGTEVSLKFPTVKLLDQEERLEEQLESQVRNPFAVVALAHLKAIQTRQKPADRLHWKLTLVKALYRHGYEREEIRRLFQFIDWLLALPEELEQEFDRELDRFEEENKMPFVTPREKAIKAAANESRQDDILKVLEARFGAVPAPVADAVHAIQGEAALDRLIRLAARAATLDEFQAGLPAAE
jgi:hypothetical protein